MAANKRHKTYFKFIDTMNTYILSAFMLMFIIVGITEIMYRDAWLGIGIIAFYSMVLYIYFKERHNKWKKLYGKK